MVSPRFFITNPALWLRSRVPNYQARLSSPTSSDYSNAGAIPIDRTGTLTTPIKVNSLFPMPTLCPMQKTYQEVCDERAVEIMKQARHLDSRVSVLWSGGIDSTAALVSLLKNSSRNDHKVLVVLMSGNSISENPNFYREHVRGKLTTDTASAVPYILGGPDIFISGEHNDQIFGSDVMAILIKKFGVDVIRKKFDREILFTLQRRIAKRRND